MRLIIAGLTFIIIIFQILSGCILFGSDDSSGDNIKVVPFESEDLSIPDTKSLKPLHLDKTKPESTDLGMEVPFKYQTTWAFSYNSVYPVYGGTMQLWLSNLGETEMYVYEFGIAPEWLDEMVTTTAAAHILPEEEVDVGYLSFPGPASDGKYSYELKFGILVRQNETSEWYDWGIVGDKTYEMEIEPLLNDTDLLDYKTEKNSVALYKKINDLVDPMDKDVRNTAVNIAKSHEGMYNVYQVCEIFQFIKNNISYVNDPRGNENYWSTPYQTVDVGAGDCEDQSVLFGALISSIGGTVRVYLTDSHAFAGIYVGSSASTRDEILSAINSFYDADLRFAWLQDELGYWLIIDTINAMHPGGLPLGGIPLKTVSSGDIDSDILGWTWDLKDTETFHLVDVI